MASETILKQKQGEVEALAEKNERRKTYPINRLQRN